MACSRRADGGWLIRLFPFLEPDFRLPVERIKIDSREMTVVGFDEKTWRWSRGYDVTLRFGLSDRYASDWFAPV